MRPVESGKGHHDREEKNNVEMTSKSKVVEMFSAPDLPGPEREQTVQVQLQKAKGYTGKRSANSYIARIEGTDPKFGFAREFREPDDINWGDSQLYKRSKGTWDEIHNLTPGLYERQTFGDRDYLLVWLKNGKATWKAIPIERAKRIAGMLQDGTRFEQARLATKPKQAQSAEAKPRPSASQPQAPEPLEYPARPMSSTPLP